MFYLTRMGEMNRVCKKCEAPFEPEPGFYFGAMYISYAFTIALFIAVSLVLYHFYDPPDWVYFTAIVALSILFIPVSFRYSRILFLYCFGGLRNRD
ncbi:MAG: DUF983 domain-containing protein [Bacteroidetes bacterium]|nr:DUF983 domain-containing protein [Bacteroidota bacterium]MBS1541161.1 DUF983 domain-containing protein [Bacteroidota bacterium]